MKDLYRNLGIDPNASREEVTAALELKPDMNECAPILLDEEKRTAYNQARGTVKTIGILRHRLNLDSEDSWFLKDSPDFAPRLQQLKKAQAIQEPAGSATMAGKNQAALQEPERPPEPSGGSNRALLIAVVVVVVMLAILAYVFL